jgi:Transposase
MPMLALAEQVDFVVGLDTHKHTHTAAIVTPTGGVVAQLTVAADAAGYERAEAFAREHAPGRRLWAVEGTGSFGAGLTTALHTIVFVRLRHHPETQAYAGRRAAEGKSPRETMRCLKRHLARRLFKLLERVVEPAASDREPAEQMAAPAPLNKKSWFAREPAIACALGGGEAACGRSGA